MHRAHEVVEASKFTELKKAEFEKKVSESWVRIESDAEKIRKKINLRLDQLMEETKEGLTRLVDNYEPKSSLKDIEKCELHARELLQKMNRT